MTLNDFLDLLLKLAILGIIAAGVGACLLTMLLSLAISSV